MRTKKVYKKCKSVSRVLSALPQPHHLSATGFTASLNQPTLPDTFLRIENEPFCDQGLFGLSTRKVYHASVVANKAVGSYSTFSPFPRQVRVVCFLWHYSVVQFLEHLPVRKYDALCCPDFPPFCKGDKATCRRKVTRKSTTRVNARQHPLVLVRIDQPGWQLLESSP